MVYLFHQFAIAAARQLLAAVLGAFVILIIGIGSLIKDHITVTFKRKYVSTDTVKEPTVVTDHNSTSRKILKTFLKGAERVDVYVIRGFIKQQHVSFFL